MDERPDPLPLSWHHKVLVALLSVGTLFFTARNLMDGPLSAVDAFGLGLCSAGLATYMFVVVPLLRLLSRSRALLAQVHKQMTAVDPDDLVLVSGAHYDKDVTLLVHLGRRVPVRVAVWALHTAAERLWDADGFLEDFLIPMRPDDAGEETSPEQPT